MDFHIKEIIEKGRIGSIIVKIEGQTFSWQWEFGGECVVAIVTVPTREEWGRIFRSPEVNRDKYLKELARELIRQKCPSCDYEIHNDCLLLVSRVR